jgi:hypothetical protein
MSRYSLCCCRPSKLVPLRTFNVLRPAHPQALARQPSVHGVNGVHIVLQEQLQLKTKAGSNARSKVAAPALQQQQQQQQKQQGLSES